LGSTLTPQSSLQSDGTHFVRWVANLQTVTNTAGTYIVSLLANAAGAKDAAGNPLAAPAGTFNVAAQDIWTYGPDVPPVGTITPVASPIGTNAGVVTIN